MSWRDKVSEKGEGSFRGAIFKYDSVESGVGRRSVVTELPGRDEPDQEDLGRLKRRFALECYVLSTPANNFDYTTDRDALIEAFETAGPGELLHPYRGLLTVVVDGEVKLKESTKQGGMATFSVTFLEVEETPPLVEIPNPVSAVLQAVSTVQAIASAVAGAVQAAQTLVNEATSALNKVRGEINSALQLVNDLQSAITDFTDTLTDIINAPGEFVQALDGLYTDVIASVNEISDAVQNLADLFGSDGADAAPNAGSALLAATRVNLLANAVSSLGGFGDDLAALPENTSGQIATASARREAIRAVKIATVTGAASAAMRLTFDNLDQALRLRDLFADVIDSVVADSSLPDELYGALADLRAALVQHLSAASDDLPELQDFSPATTLPALVIAYQLYGDAGRESEILARNQQIRDPSAVPGGQAIQVLPDA